MMIVVVSNQRINRMSPANAIIIKYTRVGTSTSVQIKRTAFTARAFAKATQIETCDSARNRTMWNRLKSAIIHK
jgi:mRNA-degrading endonuclease toxin of MazEF toxin-antitoxin module